MSQQAARPAGSRSELDDGFMQARRRFHEAALRIVSEGRRRHGDRSAEEEAAFEHAEAGLAFQDAVMRKLEPHMEANGPPSGAISFVNMDSVSPLAAPAHILALQASIDQLNLQRKALECLISYIRTEREGLEGRALPSSHPQSESTAGPSRGGDV